MKVILDFVTNSSETDYYDCSDCDCRDCDCDCRDVCDCRDCDCDCDCRDCDCRDCDCDCDARDMFPPGPEGDAQYEDWLDDLDD